MRKTIFIANYNITSDPARGLSGGDRIWIELLRRWRKRFETALLGSEDSSDLARYHGIEDIQTIITAKKVESDVATARRLLSLGGLVKHTFYRTWRGVLALIRHRRLLTDADYVYSVSDFYPDFLLALLLKLIKRRIKWIAGYYLFASSPFSTNSPYKGKDWLKGLIYWLGQKPSYFLVRRFADVVLVTSAPDAIKFTNKAKKNQQVIVVRGGVNISESEKYLNSEEVISPDKRIFDACYLGRFHVQKGVLDLVKIWKLVTARQPEAKLAMIGNGELEQAVKDRIRELGLEKNIELFGFLDGERKYEVFKKSKLVVHPAIYDSGGMAAAEAMAWGLPGVSFDLEALKTYYPKGMVKTPCFDLNQFAANILKLLDDMDFYVKMSKEAHDLIVKEWGWDKSSNIIMNKILGGKLNE